MIPQFGRGALTGFADTTFNGNITMAAGKHVDASAAGCLIKYDGANTTAPPIQAGNDSNTGIGSAAADTLVTWAGGVATIGTTAALVSLNVAGNATQAFEVTGPLNANAYTYTPKLYLPETTAPAPLADAVILYCVADGAKTDGQALFQTGAAVKFTEEV